MRRRYLLQKQPWSAATIVTAAVAQWVGFTTSPAVAAKGQPVVAYMYKARRRVRAATCKGLLINNSCQPKYRTRGKRILQLAACPWQLAEGMMQAISPHMASWYLDVDVYALRHRHGA